MANSNIFQFKTLNSFVAPSFWHKLAEIKIDIDRLNEDRKPINGFYTNSDATHCLLETDGTSFNQEFSGRSCLFQSHGAIFNKNRIEEFKSCDKLALIQQEGNLIWKDIASGAILQRPSLLSRFIILSFGDLKAFTYYYWFAFPCPSEPHFTKIGESVPIASIFNETRLNLLNEQYFLLPSDQRAFFILQSNSSDNSFVLDPLHARIDVEKKDLNFVNDDLENLYFCFSDPCSDIEYTGWQLRLFLLALLHLCPKLKAKTIKVLSIRVKKTISLKSSVMFTILLPEEGVSSDKIKWIGWEPNNEGKFLPRCVSLASSMDPQRLAETGVYLNLKLMKWRLLPDLDLKRNMNTKCLLFGAGTLGCSVARNLLAWGIQHISFIDSGAVSFSNPVRQNLYTHDDAAKKRDKATTAAARLMEIHPGINASGHVLRVPMPGYPIGKTLKQKNTETLTKIEELVREHDAIFLLTDSRESRWLPTMLAAANNKIVINAALGFDSYLVMRHGCNPIDEKSSAIDVNGLKCVAGNRLGCYFCNDITSPGDSMKDRTLDQQCTVTRPAVSSIAGALAVELLISIIQHPTKAMCPAYFALNNTNLNEKIDAIPEHLLGVVPHSIRGSVNNFEQILPATERFSQCVACSQKILNAYQKNGKEFLFNVFESPKILEDLSGISEMLNIQHEEILEFEESLDLELSD